MWLETRKETGEACGLCTEVAEGPNNQDPMRMKTKKVILGWIQLGRFNELERTEAPVRNCLGDGRGVATLTYFEAPPIHQPSAPSGAPLTVMGK